MIKTIFIDLGGVLILNKIRKTTEDWAKKLQIDPQILKTISKEYSTLKMSGMEISYKTFIKNKKIKQITPQQLENFQKAIWNSEYVNTELLEFIKRTKNTYKYGVITNNFKKSEELLLTKFHIPKFYSFFISSSEIGILKPDPEIYIYALKKAGIEASETVFIDDSLENVNGAKSVGMKVIQFQNNNQLFSDFEVLNTTLN